jgi:hypothetical protein
MASYSNFQITGVAKYGTGDMVRATVYETTGVLFWKRRRKITIFCATGGIWRFEDGRNAPVLPVWRAFQLAYMKTMFDNYDTDIANKPRE